MPCGIFMSSATWTLQPLMTFMSNWHRKVWRSPRFTFPTTKHLTPSILFHFHAHLNVRDSAHLALWSAPLVGFFTFFWTTNLVPQTFTVSLHNMCYPEAASTSTILAPFSQSSLDLHFHLTPAHLYHGKVPQWWYQVFSVPYFFGPTGIPWS